MVSAISYLVGALITAFAPVFVVMVIGRFIYGIGIGLVIYSFYSLSVYYKSHLLFYSHVNLYTYMHVHVYNVKHSCALSKSTALISLLTNWICIMYTCSFQEIFIS